MYLPYVKNLTHIHLSFYTILFQKTNKNRTFSAGKVGRAGRADKENLPQGTVAQLNNLTSNDIKNL